MICLILYDMKNIIIVKTSDRGIMFRIKNQLEICFVEAGLHQKPYKPQLLLQEFILFLDFPDSFQERVKGRSIVILIIVIVGNYTVSCAIAVEIIIIAVQKESICVCSFQQRF